ncbi:type 1 glutamine amidotransferase domain-containing protein [Kutzneria viridogrisea]|uniref:Intracellular protease/amidase n=1 Tax=Kutzneria viridogrisea TaxID=47990 RepID=A0ABR6B8P8_9PSEU|nr:putative intracellular protease/amidase [Kutzneria viridogrisea]
MTTIAILLASADSLTLNDGETYSCGYWAEELVGPWRLFTEQGATVLVTTPEGRKATAEPASLVPETASLSQQDCDDIRSFLDEHATELDAPVAASQLDLSAVAGIYVPGGYAPLAQLHDHPEVGTLVTAARERSVPIATVCHGAAALLACRTATSPWPYAGQTITSFSDAEEKTAGMLGKLTWTLEQALREAGAHHQSAEPWSENLTETPGLITGQNPASCIGVAKALLRQVR